MDLTANAADLAHRIEQTYSPDTITAGFGLMALAEVRAQVDREISAGVARMRENGATWSRVGMCLGLSAQGTQQRYGT